MCNAKTPRLINSTSLISGQKRLYPCQVDILWFLTAACNCIHYLQEKESLCDTSVREASKGFLIKYFPNILSLFDMPRSGDCREALTCLAAVVTATGKFISGLSKTFVLPGLPSRECNPRSLSSSPFLSVIPCPPLFPHIHPPSDIHTCPWLTYPVDFVCEHVCVCVREKFLGMAQELCAVTHFLPEARALRRGREEEEEGGCLRI